MTPDGNGAGGRLLLVTYHYVRDETYPYPGIHPITPSQFREQIAALRERFAMASIEQAEAFVLGRGELPAPSVLLTFDDGLREHLQIAREVLEPLGLHGLFFVSSRPLQEGRALAVSKIHWLRAITPPNEFRAALTARMPSELLKLDAAAEEAARVSYPYDKPEDAKLKYLMNFVLAHDVVDAALSDMLHERGIDEVEFCRSTYMSESNLRQLHRSGHVVGGHSHGHVPLARLSRAALKADLGRNLDFLEEVLGARPRWFSYPYGNPSAVPEDSSVLSEGFGVKFAVTLFRGWVSMGQDRYKLRRINTNEVASYAAFADACAG
jgi:peptidoglycan/xylan/chitin deacetylase (PgdA/CDA1 family)